MKNKEKLIFMYKDLEVLSFEVDYKKSNITFLEKLEHFDKAPYGMNEKDANINMLLFRFFNSRSIPIQRYNYKEIMEATGCKDSFVLSFKGHGLSLSNHYWFKRKGENLKYSDINFFTNKWDDSYARAILNEDYDALKTCDLNVPDIVTPGWASKGWIYDNGPKLYKIGIIKDHYEDCLGEVLASKLAQRILNDGEVVKYELKKFGDKYASVSSGMIGINEELIPLSRVLPRELYDLYHEKHHDKKILKAFFDKVAEYGMPGLFEFFVKIQCLRTICFASDLHFDNLSFIRNTDTGELRIAPIYDLAGAFGSSKSGREFVSNITKGSYIIVYFIFSGLEPEWDYSWYNPDKLIGFEDDIKEILSYSDFYTPELLEKIIDVYHQQKSSLDEMLNEPKK